MSCGATTQCLIALCLAAAIALQGCGGGGTTTPSPGTRPSLPKRMIAGYTSGASTEKITLAVKEGLNVIFWSFMELHNNTLTGGVTSKAVGEVVKALKDMNREDVIHFVSFGGWNVQHSLAGTCGASKCSGKAYATAFRKWNAGMMSSVPGFAGFAGIDWDIEGVNTLNSTSNAFNMETYEVMLNMSQALRGDFLISMVPPESYFNCRKSGFDTTLRHTAEQDHTFTYAGLNTYTALYAKCPDCFDLVMVQLYESYSPSGFELYWAGNESNVGKAGWPRKASSADMTTVINNNMKCLEGGWEVNFNGFWGLANQTVSVPASKLVIGLANGWAHPVASGKFKVPFFDGKPCGEAWCQGVTHQNSTERIRGFMYWDISDDTANASLVIGLMSGMATCNKTSSEAAVFVV